MKRYCYKCDNVVKKKDKLECFHPLNVHMVPDEPSIFDEVPREGLVVPSEVKMHMETKRDVSACRTEGGFCKNFGIWFKPSIREAGL